MICIAACERAYQPLSISARPHPYEDVLLPTYTVVNTLFHDTREKIRIPAHRMEMHPNFTPLPIAYITRPPAPVLHSTAKSSADARGS